MLLSDASHLIEHSYLKSDRINGNHLGRVLISLGIITQSSSTFNLFHIVFFLSKGIRNNGMQRALLSNKRSSLSLSAFNHGFSRFASRA